jgi:hypothetical protein
MEIQLSAGRRVATAALALLTALALALSFGPSTASAGAGQGDGHAVSAAKKKKKKKKKRKKGGGAAPVGTPVPTAPLTPLALTEAEVINRVVLRAEVYCNEDPNCIDFGYYEDGAGQLDCESRSTYTWSCYGWNDEDATFDPPNATCDFREIVSRTGYSGITSQQDLSFADEGWDCYVMHD